MYDQRGCVLRIETAMNNPGRFRAWRRGPDGKRAWLPLRQGVADLRRRVEIAQAANTRYLEALASVPLGQPACRVLDPVSRPVKRGSQRFRGLRPVAAEEAHLFASVTPCRSDHPPDPFVAGAQVGSQAFRNQPLPPHTKGPGPHVHRLEPAPIRCQPTSQGSMKSFPKRQDYEGL